MWGYRVTGGSLSVSRRMLPVAGGLVTPDAASDLGPWIARHDQVSDDDPFRNRAQNDEIHPRRRRPHLVEIGVTELELGGLRDPVGVRSMAQVQTQEYAFGAWCLDAGTGLKDVTPPKTGEGRRPQVDREAGKATCKGRDIESKGRRRYAL
jgi:hypothetical protein